MFSKINSIKYYIIIIVSNSNISKSNANLQKAAQIYNQPIPALPGGTTAPLSPINAAAQRRQVRREQAQTATSPNFIIRGNQPQSLSSSHSSLNYQNQYGSGVVGPYASHQPPSNTTNNNTNTNTNSNNKGGFFSGLSKLIPSNMAVPGGRLRAKTSQHVDPLLAAASNNMSHPIAAARAGLGGGAGVGGANGVMGSHASLRGGNVSRGGSKSALFPSVGAGGSSSQKQYAGLGYSGR
jgi:hypothetical protein